MYIGVQYQIDLITGNQELNFVALTFDDGQSLYTPNSGCPQGLRCQSQFLSQVSMWKNTRKLPDAL